MTSEMKAGSLCHTSPHLQSTILSKVKFKRSRPLRLHTATNPDEELLFSFCQKNKRPLEVKQYSNKFLRESSPFELEQSRQLKPSLSKRLFRHKIDDKQNSVGRLHGRTQTSFSTHTHQPKPKASDKISTSRALQLFSKILRTNKTEGSVIEYHRRSTFRNTNFNIQRIQLQQKRELKVREFCRSVIKSEAKTQQVGRRYERPQKLVNLVDNMDIDPWEIYVDNDF